MVEPREAEAKGQKFLHAALLLGNHPNQQKEIFMTKARSHSA